MNAPHGAVMCWPLTAVETGEELTRDAVPGQRSLQRASMLLSLLSPRYENSNKCVDYINEEVLSPIGGICIEGEAHSLQHARMLSPCWKHCEKKSGGLTRSCILNGSIACLYGL